MILINRILTAMRMRIITNTRDKRRRYRHAVAMLRRHRPAVYWPLHAQADAARPTACPRCAQPIVARPLGDRWLWTCKDCDVSGVVVRPSIADLLIQTGAKRAVDN